MPALVATPWRRTAPDRWHLGARLGSALVVLAATLASSGCVRGRSRSLPPVPIRSALRDSLLDVDMRRGGFANRSGIVRAMSDWLDPHAVYLRSGAAVAYGAATALRVATAGLPPAAVFRWQPLGGGVARDGRHGYTYGVATIATDDGSAVRVQTSQYLAFWRRGNDPTWRIAAYSEVQGLPVRSDSASLPGDLPQSPSLPHGPRAAAARQVWQADSAFALAADLQGTGIAFSTYVAPYGAIFAGPELVVGPPAVKEVFEEQQHAGGTLNWRPIYADAADSGDLGFTIGESVFTGRGTTGSVVQRFGKYLTIWSRQPNGAWRFVIDGGNANPVPAR